MSNMICEDIREALSYYWLLLVCHPPLVRRMPCQFKPYSGCRGLVRPMPLM